MPVMLKQVKNATITIKINPKDVKGEATLIINGVESKNIFKR